MVAHLRRRRELRFGRGPIRSCQLRLFVELEANLICSRASRSEYFPPVEVFVSRIVAVLTCLIIMLCVTNVPALPQDTAAAANVAGHYLFAWTGDADKKGMDFLAVIDAGPASATYGKLITTLVTDQPTMRVHHTEYVMRASGMLFANDHSAGRTFIFDVRDALHPEVVTSFTDMDGYMHPHSYLRRPCFRLPRDQ